ncbi:MAG: ATP-binding cassette domain-containing protein [Proteobacteria bacterium]|nr:ATP-binding cassette domain-containing protein [Pseudomonadota bacterium]
MRRMVKRFGSVHAVEDVSIDLRAGEVVGLLGHNGAGKSTLVKMLSGAEPADGGEIRIAGEIAQIRNPRDARRLGVETLYQDLALADNLDTPANLFLGRELRTPFGTLDDHAMERAAAQVIGRLNPSFGDLRAPVRNLSGGQRQSVAIARALHFNARILIMDEPTAALGPEETAMVVEIIRQLAREGLGIFLVSHDLHGVFDLSDRVAVMKNGRLVDVCATSEVTPDDVLAMIITGEPLSSVGG